MRVFLIVWAIFTVGVISKSIDGDFQSYQNCITEYGLTKEVVRSPNITDEQTDCVFACYMKRVKWLNSDGSFNIDVLHEEKNETKKNEGIAIVNFCNQQVKGNVKDTCELSGCLRRNHIANAFS